MSSGKYCFFLSDVCISAYTAKIQAAKECGAKLRIR